MYRFVKRFCDIFLSAVVLIILSPILIPVIIGLKFTGEGHIFYFQQRIGYKRKYFQMWKFATMLQNSPEIGTGEITVKNDPRLLPMGKFLRKTKINELPQILNVLIGNMSIVGPRPLVDSGFNVYSDFVKTHVYDSKPGITGIGSIFFRDEEDMISRSNLSPQDFYKQHIAPYKGELEMWYQAHKSFATDFKIIILTAWVILFPKSKLVNVWFKDLPQGEVNLVKNSNQQHEQTKEMLKFQTTQRS